MHNLLLGTAKHMFSLWVSTEVISKSDFAKIQDTVDSYVTPTDIGRTSQKISSGFSSFTAEQWRNWILVYSLCSIKGYVPYRH